MIPREPMIVEIEALLPVRQKIRVSDAHDEDQVRADALAFAARPEAWRGAVCEGVRVPLGARPVNARVCGLWPEGRKSGGKE